MSRDRPGTGRGMGSRGGSGETSVAGLLPLRARSRDKPRSYRYLHIPEGLRLAWIGVGARLPANSVGQLTFSFQIQRVRQQAGSYGFYVGRKLCTLPSRTRLIPFSDKPLTLRDMAWQRLPV